MNQAFDVKEFCRRFSIGRTTTYAEIRAGRLRAVKVGRRTLITSVDAENWLQALRPVHASDICPVRDALVDLPEMKGK